MPHYMFRATYSQQGIQGVIKDGAASRVAAVEAMAGSVGGRILAAYWAFGDTTSSRSRSCRTTRRRWRSRRPSGRAGTAGVTTTVLLTAAEVDEALARKTTYRAPGT